MSSTLSFTLRLRSRSLVPAPRIGKFRAVHAGRGVDDGNGVGGKRVRISFLLECDPVAAGLQLRGEAVVHSKDKGVPGEVGIVADDMSTPFPGECVSEWPALRCNPRKAAARDDSATPLWCRPPQALVAVPLIAHALTFERLILGRRNFQFLVSNVASNPITKHLDIHLRWCSNRSFQSHWSFQVRTALPNRSRKIVVNCCPHSRRNDAKSAHRKWLRHANPPVSTETCKRKLNYER